MANVLVVAVFTNEDVAWNAVVTATEAAAGKGLGLDDACLIVRRPDGKIDIRETSDISPGKAGWYGGAWGLLAGAVLGFPLAAAAVGVGAGHFAARRRDVGITDAFEQEVAGQLVPGTCAAVALVDQGAAAQVKGAAEKLGAWTTTVELEETPGLVRS